MGIDLESQKRRFFRSLPWAKIGRLIFAWAVLFAWICPNAAWSQTRPGAAFTIPLNADAYTLKTWPDPGDVQCDDPSVKRALQDAIQAAQKARPAPVALRALVGVINTQLSKSLFQITSPSIGPIFKGLMQPISTQPVACLMVSDYFSARDSHAFRCTLADLAANSTVQVVEAAQGIPRIQLTQDQGSIPVGFVSDPHSPWLGLQHQTGDALRQNIDRAADFAVLALLGEQQIARVGVDPALKNHDSIFADLRSRIDSLYGGYLRTPDKNYQTNNVLQFTPWTTYSLFQVNFLEPVQDAVVKVSQVSYGGGQPFPVDQLEAKVGKRAAGLMNSQIAQLQQDATADTNRYFKKEKFMSQLSADKLRFVLQQEYPHLQAVTLSQVGNQLKVDITYRPTYGNLAANAGYGSPGGGTGSVSLSVQDCFVPNDAFTASLTGGPDAYSGSAGYQAVIARSTDYAWNLTVAPSVQYSQLSKILLGNPDGPYVHVDTLTAGAQLTLDYDSTRQMKPGQPIVLSTPVTSTEAFSVGLNTYYRSAWVRGPASVIGPDPEGSSPCAFLSSSWQSLHLFGPPDTPSAQLDLGAKSNVGVVIDYGNASSTYLSAQLCLTSTCFFAWKNPKDFLVRGIAGGAHVGDGAPRFDYPSLGGDEIDRGLFAGNVIGRTTAYETGEFGVSAGAFLGPDLTKSMSDSTGFNLSSLYLKAIIDHGDAWSRPAIANARVLNSDSFSYGGGVEYDGVISANPVSFSFGYAWSPESVHGGRVFTQVSAQF